VIGPPFAHVGGIPIEETIGPFGSALLVMFGLAWARLRARLRHGWPRRRHSSQGGTSPRTASIES
jgi:hypothetical protein